MYDWPEIRDETDRYWSHLYQAFEEAGCDAPSALTRPDDEALAWSQDDLFFSQTCGYPFSKFPEGQAHLLSVPSFAVPGWSGGTYSSAVVVAKTAPCDTLDDTRELRFAYNGENSLSGFRCLSPLLGHPFDWFKHQHHSSGHRASLDRISDGQADIAAIDAYCWYLYQMIEPKRAERLRVLAWTPALPALPYITRGSASEEELNRMKRALKRGVENAVHDDNLSILALSGLGENSVDDYAKLRHL